MEPTLIGIVGKAKVGKDTVAKYLTRKYNYHQFAYATELKKIVKNLFNLTSWHVDTQAGKESLHSCGKTIRTILQETGNNLREVYPDIWVDFLMKDILNKNSKFSVISDIRYLNVYYSK
jgi:cytidylate kinase